MPRQVRIEFPGAYYHVMARGDRREDIYLDDADREMFLATLTTACKKTGWRVHAYVLMSNHYHLVVETPEANLVQGMSWLQGTYTSRFNARHQLRGHVFGGRYKSILVERDDVEYFARLIEYVHLNPVRARIVKRRQPLDGYPWSSLRYYRTPPSKRRDWEIAEEGLASAGCRDNARGRRCYLEWLEEQIAWEKAEEAGLVEIEGQSLQSTLRRGWYFGSQAFRERMLALGEKQLSARSGSDLYRGPEIKDHSLDRAEKIMHCGLRFFSLKEEGLRSLPKSDWRKALIAVVIKEQTTASLQWLSERLHMGARAGVSRYASHLSERAVKEQKLRAQLRQLRKKARNITISKIKS